MSTWANHLINERLGTNREGIRDAYRSDAQTKLSIDLLRRFCGTVEDACRALDIDQDTMEKLLQIVVTGSVPSMPDVLARKETEESYHQLLRRGVSPLPPELFQG
jgi:hypothetical protein